MAVRPPVKQVRVTVIVSAETEYDEIDIELWAKARIADAIELGGADDEGMCEVVAAAVVKAEAL